MTRAIALLAIGWILMPAHAAGPSKADAYYDKALNHYREGDFESSMSLLSKALLDDRRHLPSFALRAQIRHILGDKVGLSTDLEKALRIQTSRKPPLLSLRGNARLLAGDRDSALKDFNAAIEIDDENADAYLGRGRLQRDAGRPKKALADWVQALKLDPNLYLARYNLAWALYELGRPDRAIKQLTKALRGNPSFHLPYNLLGIIFAERGDNTRALKAYSKALYLRPEFTYARSGRALVYLKLGKRKLAFKDLDEAVKNARGDYSPYYHRGEVLHRIGKTKEALQDYSSALALEIPHAAPTRLMGTRFAKAEQWAKAAQMYTKTLSALQKQPQGAAKKDVEWALLARADALEHLEQNERAYQDADAAVRVSSDSARAWTARGRLHQKLDRVRNAFNDFDQAVKLDAAFAPALLARGNIRAQNRVYKEALEDLSAAVAADPTLSEAFNNRGVIYATVLDDYDKAVTDLDRAVKLRPKSPGFHLNLGMARLKRHDYWKSVEALNRALELKAPVARVFHYRAQAYYALGNVAKSVSDIEEAMKLEPQEAVHAAVLGSFRLRSRDYIRAIKILDKAIAMDKKNGQAYLYRGLAYGGIGEYSRASRSLSRAARLLEKPTAALTYNCQSERLRGRLRSAVTICSNALRRNPDYGPAYVQRGMALLKLRDYAKAVRDLDDGTRLGPPTAEAYLARSLAHIPLKQFSESDKAYRAAIRLDPTARHAELTMGIDPKEKTDYQLNVDRHADLLEDNPHNPNSYLVRGNALHSAGYYDRAILEYTRAMEMNGKLVGAYLDRGTALAAQESLDAAEHDMRRAVDLAPGDPETHLGLVTLLTARRRYGKGLKAVISALRKQAKNPNADTFVKAGNLRYFLEDVDKAQENFRLALKFDPKHAAAHNGLGLCQFARRQYALALESFSRAVAIDSEYDRFYRNRASTYVNLRDFANAAADYTQALNVNKDPEMVEGYQKLIDQSKKMAPNRQKVSAKKTKAAGE
jgi:tetratricopeptide (TPR) repeat protein